MNKASHCYLISPIMLLLLLISLVLCYSSSIIVVCCLSFVGVERNQEIYIHKLHVTFEDSGVSEGAKSTNLKFILLSTKLWLRILSSEINGFARDWMKSILFLGFSTLANLKY